MSRHTYGHRVDEVVVAMGLGDRRPPIHVTVLAPTNRPEFLDRLIDNFAGQRDVDADLIVLTNSERFDRAAVDARLAGIGNARAIHLPAGLTMGECLNVGLGATGARFVAKFDDDDLYGAHYLADALLAHRYTDAAIVGKKTFYAHLEGPDETVLRFPGNEFSYVNRVTGSTMVLDRQVLGDLRFGELNSGEDVDLYERVLELGLGVFSTDRFNYVTARRADTSTHSWPVSDHDFRAGSVRVARGLALDRIMV